VLRFQGGAQLGQAGARGPGRDREQHGGLPALLFGLVQSKAVERGDDLTSDLLAIYDEDPEALIPEEIASILFSLSFAGHETTTGLIGNMVRRLLEDRTRWEAVVADPQLAGPAVDETLRYDTSVPAWRRVTTRPVTLPSAKASTIAWAPASASWRQDWR
jgi:cytochrome P450